MKTKTEIIGTVGVDSGQLLIIDPAYIDGNWIFTESTSEDFAHTVYVHKESGKLWQFTFGNKSSVPSCNPFPGRYDDIIPEYGKSPNELIESGEFERTDLDPTPHIPDDEFSYRGVCKARKDNETARVHKNLAVVTGTGYGDGGYPVIAKMTEDGRVASIHIIFINEDEEDKL